MTAETKFNLLILWEHELRTAIKAFQALTKKDRTEKDFVNALKAGAAALYYDGDVDNSAITIMCAAKPKK
jgi:hypothetical protein